ncbi:MAG: type II toxin-antitoxin system PemK/MazF family toxin [Clostridia bacterium]|nr:type II toxin-antitoxin system PemK/MazF family toxin [Clostridia bacterium]
MKGELEEKSEEYINATAHKKNALNQLDSLMTYYIENGNYKKVDLLSYWFETFTNYIFNEDSFNPKSLIKYKRGSIIKANLGFNVGNEEGGLHYCLVVDKSNDMSSGTLTVIPLTSRKENKNYNKKTTLDLGNEIYKNLAKTFNGMSKKISNEYQNIWNLPNDKVEQFSNDFKYLKKVEKEIQKMKKGSIALVSQITTLSKQRIYDPKTALDILANMRVSDSTLDLIDDKIKELFIK